MKMTGDAVKHAMAGLHVFPVEPMEKTPARLYPDRSKEDAPWTIKWSECATRDVGRVIDMWTRNPEANIGVACKPSGLLVVDCDRPKRAYQLRGTPYEHLHDILGPLVDGESVYDQVCQRFGGDWTEASDTYQVATGSGGRHFYYRWPYGVQSSQASIVKGILDIRGNGGERGGYVLGGGSETTSGTYVAVGDLANIAPAPTWLVALCREQTHAPRNVQPRSSRDAYDRPTALSYRGLVDAVMYAQEGNRNNALLWAARQMCTEEVSEDECQEALGEAARIAGLTALETRDTIRSAYRLQKGKM